MMATWMTMAHGIKGFFEPNPWAFAGQRMPLDPEASGYYGTAPLRDTLNRLVDFRLIGADGCRLTVGAANVRTSEMTYFDSRHMPLTADHVMASGALPPAFPPILIDNELYWDGGILSNTPVEAVFDDVPRRSSLVFAVHLWNPRGPEPRSIWDVTHRQKEMQYSSRAASQILKQKQLHRLRHVIAELTEKLPSQPREDPEVQEYSHWGCLAQMHVVRLLAPRLQHEDYTKDIDFSREGIRQRRQAGYEHAVGMLKMAPWKKPVDKMEGVILHESEASDQAIIYRYPRCQILIQFAAAFLMGIDVITSFLLPRLVRNAAGTVPAGCTGRRWHSSCQKMGQCRTNIRRRNKAYRRCTSAETGRNLATLCPYCSGFYPKGGRI
jgi:NTE family protein